MIAIAKKASPTSEVGRRLGPVDVLVLSIWCGLAAGELEVIARVLFVRFSSADRMYLMPRHFVWLVPLINLGLFLGAGLFLSGARDSGRAGRLVEPATHWRVRDPAGTLGGGPPGLLWKPG